ncbi:MAG: type II toxin-antitoxin system HicB family antitoxin [Oceanicaulis sp.]
MARDLEHPGVLYPATAVEHGPGDWTVELVDWPEVAAGGASFEEARRDAVGALEEAALHRLAVGDPIPSPSARSRGQTEIGLTPLAVLKIALNRWVDHHGRGAQSELARRLGWDSRGVRQVLAPKKGKVSTDRLVEAATAAGYCVEVTLHPVRRG